MGTCCSACLETLGAAAASASGASSPRQSETELRASGAGADAAVGPSLGVSRALSAPTVDLSGPRHRAVAGHGLALVAAPVEQDSAYWEAHVERPAGPGGTEAPPVEVLFGVSPRRDRSFFKALEDLSPAQQAEQGTELMRKIKVKHGDTVGVAVQQDDLPMVQFLLNGEPLPALSINKFRGTVHPSVFLPGSDQLSVRLVFDEGGFRELAPTVRFGPLIVARGLI